MFRTVLFFVLTLLAISNRPYHAAGNDVALKRFLGTYCNACHGEDKQNGDRRFDQLSLPVSKVDTLIDLKDILDQINLGDMPPREAPQPSEEESKMFIEQATQALTEGRESLASTGGSTVLRRLNRREYINTIGDLFGLNMDAFDPTTKFPRDQSAEHMENLGNVLQTSGYLLDQYIDAADVIVEKEFALQKAPPARTWQFNGEFKFKTNSEKRRNEYGNRHLLVLECMDSNTHEGGYGFINDFRDGVPADGFYEIQVLVKAMNREHPYAPAIFGIDMREPFRLGIVPGDAKLGPLDLPQSPQPMLAERALEDGDAQWVTMQVWLDKGYTPRFVFPNGPKESRTTWFKIADYHKDQWSVPPSENGKRTIGIVEAHDLAEKVCKFPHIRIDEVKIRGPLAELRPEVPQQAAFEKAANDPKSMRSVLGAFASRAYRRPVTQEELDRLMKVAIGRVEKGHSKDEGFKDAIKTVLCSPGFLYHSQAVVADDQAPTNRPKLDDYALATRLSYFLWASTPDNELLRVAHSKQLSKPEVLLAQTRRMLESPRSDAFISGFLDSWLNLRSLGGTPPDRKEFETYYSKDLEHAFKEETKLFVRDLIDRDASIINFLDCDYTFVNQPLATHYELGELGDPARAKEFRKVSLTDPRRGGLLGMGSVLTISANGIETSPVVRGVFLLENILGTPPPPPPDDVPAIDPDVRGSKSIRDLLKKHRESPSCYGCHQKIDPLGFALENFDPVGSWRTSIDKTKIDSSGELPSGEKFSDVVGLKKILKKRQRLFARMLTDRLFTYACGRRMESLDESTVEKTVEKVSKAKYGMRSLIEAVVMSELFRSS